jgi:hypothetical protein
MRMETTSNPFRDQTGDTGDWMNVCWKIPISAGTTVVCTAMGLNVFVVSGAVVESDDRLPSCLLFL